MNHSLGILSSGVKLALHLVHFITNFELQLQVVTKNFLVIFDFSLLEWRAVKNRAHDFWFRFDFFEILAYITVLLPLKSVLKMENRS